MKKFICLIITALITTTAMFADFVETKYDLDDGRVNIIVADNGSQFAQLNLENFVAKQFEQTYIVKPNDVVTEYGDDKDLLDRPIFHMENNLIKTLIASGAADMISVDILTKDLNIIAVFAVKINNKWKCVTATGTIK